MIDKVKLTKM